MVVHRWVDTTSEPSKNSGTSRKWEGFSVKLEGKHLDEWKIGPYIDEGAFGVVHEATHLHSGELAALKMMKPEMVTLKRLERFQREAIALGRVDHPNVVHYLGSGRAEVVGTPVFFIALELLKGKTLQDEIDERGRLPEHYALWITGQIVAGLEAVNAHRIVHGDLKPSNVYLTEDGQVKVMDFGHSQLLEFENLTKVGSFIGTAPFAAPEQFIDSSSIDSRADEYSLGCLLYYMLTGSVPFPEASTMVSIADAHQKSQAAPVRYRNPQVSYFTHALVNRLMAKKPIDRFARLSDLAAVLTSRERANFFYSLLPERHQRNLSAAFWAEAVRPRYPMPRCPVLELPALSIELNALTKRVEDGYGRTLIVRGPRGAGVTRALFESFQERKDLQLARGRIHYPGENPFTPVRNMFDSLFPHHSHAKFSWEEQFRFITSMPPDQWGTLRIFLNDPDKYVENFGQERDARLAGEIALVLMALAQDMPLVISWDHCEQYDQRLVSLLMKLIPKLQQAPILSVLTGPRPGSQGYPPSQAAWGALSRSLMRHGSGMQEFDMPQLDTVQLQKLLGYFFSDEGDLRFLITRSKGFVFPSYHAYFTWVGYWKETLHLLRVTHGRQQLTPGDYQALVDPLIGGSSEKLLAGRFKFLSRLHQRALTVMAEEGEYFGLPRAQNFREELSDLDLVRILQDLERRWFIVTYRNHGHFRNPAFVNYLRANPAPR